MAALLDVEQRRLAIPASRPRRSATPTRSQATTLGLKNLERVGGMLLAGDDVKPGEPYDDLQRALRPAARPVGARDEPRRRRSSAASTRSRSTAARPACCSRRSPKARQAAAVQFLNAQRLPDAGVPGQAGDAAPDRAGRRARSRCGPRSSACWRRCSRARRVLRLVEREAIDGAGAYAPDRLPGRRPPRRLDRAGRPAPVTIDAVPAQPAAGLARDAGRAGQRPAGGVRRRPRAVPPGAAPARRRSCRPRRAAARTASRGPTWPTPGP